MAEVGNDKGKVCSLKLMAHRRSAYHVRCRKVFTIRPNIYHLAHELPPCFWGDPEAWESDDAKSAIAEFMARALALDPCIDPFAIRVHFMWHWLGLYLQLVSRSCEEVTGENIVHYCYPLVLLQRCKQLCREAGW